MKEVYERGLMYNQFYFRGFLPSEELKLQANLLLKDLLSLAPGEAHSLATVELLDDHYIARMDIYSKLGPFLGDVTASEPLLALQKLSEKMQKILEHWQKQRTSQGKGFISRRDPFTYQPIVPQI